MASQPYPPTLEDLSTAIASSAPAEPRVDDAVDTVLSFAESTIETANAIVERMTTERVVDTIMAKDGTLHMLVTMFLGATDWWDEHKGVLLPLTCSLASLSVTLAYMTGPEMVYTRGDGERMASLIPLLMILGEQVVAKATAVTTSNTASSVLSGVNGCGFGWLSYSLSILVPALSGTGDLLPKPEVECKILNLTTGQNQTNRSWVLSRILRDMEASYGHALGTGGLTIEVLDAIKPCTDSSVWNLIKGNIPGLLISLLQLTLGITFTWSTGDPSVLCLLITLHFLAMTLSSLPAWDAQKFNARKDHGKNDVYALMRGIGHRHVFIIRNVHPNAWNLEDLAAGGPARYDYAAKYEWSVMNTAFLSFLTLAILSTNLSSQSAICMIALMTLGTMGNLISVTMPRELEKHGVLLRSVDVISSSEEGLDALKRLEEKYPGFGKPLEMEFSPGGVEEEGKTEDGAEKKTGKNKKRNKKNKAAATSGDGAQILASESA